MALQSLRSRFQGLGAAKAPENPLETQLNRATSAESVDVPEDAVNAILRASHNEQDRRLIMLHVHNCLAASASSQWRRVYSGIIVLEALMDRGSPDIINEVANGVHCDLVQRLSFLAVYEYSYDSRVQDMIRRKAEGLRAVWQEKQQALEAELEFQPSREEEVREPVKAQKAPVAVANLLDDYSTTDSESGAPDFSLDSPSAGTAAKPQAGLDDLLDFGAPEQQPAPAMDLMAAAAPAEPAGLADLLGDNSSPGAPATAPPPPPPQKNLLDF